MIKTNENKIAGELAVREMSENAQKFYNDSEPLTVYEYQTENGKRYAYDGALGSAEGLTFEEIQAAFENYYNEFNA